MDFDGMTVEMKQMFMNWYNDEVGKKPTIYGAVMFAIFLTVGYFVFFKLAHAFGVYHADVPGWIVLIFMAWFPFSYFYGVRIGIRMYHRTNRTTLIYAISKNITESTFLTDDQKTTLRNYTVYYIDTTAPGISDLSA